MSNTYYEAKRMFLQDAQLVEGKRIAVTFKNTLSKLFFSPWLKDDIQEWTKFLGDDSEFKSATISVDKFNYKLSQKGLWGRMLFDMSVSFTSDNGIQAYVTNQMKVGYHPLSASFDKSSTRHTTKIQFASIGGLLKNEVGPVKKRLVSNIVNAMDDVFEPKVFQNVLDEVLDKGVKDYEKEAKKKLKKPVKFESYDGVFISKLSFKPTEKFLDSYFRVGANVSTNDDDANGSIFYDVKFKLYPDSRKSGITSVKMKAVSIGE